LAGGAEYAGKPRPAVIVQEDAFHATGSVVVCGFTTKETDAPLYRIPVDPSQQNGLREPSRIMIDKIAGVPREKLGERIGVLEPEHLSGLERALLVFLGLARQISDD
jgi:mRNA interferase MazF